MLACTNEELQLLPPSGAPGGAAAGGGSAEASAAEAEAGFGGCRAALELKLAMVASAWEACDSYDDPPYKFAWKPPKPKAVGAAGAAAAGGASSSSSSSAPAAAAAAGVATNSAYFQKRAPDAKKHVLQLQVTATGPGGGGGGGSPAHAVAVCVFDTLTVFNLHRVLAHTLHFASRGPARESELDGRSYRFVTASQQVCVGGCCAKKFTCLGTSPARVLE